MKRTDHRRIYLDLELHEILGDYNGITSSFKQKRDYLRKVLVDRRPRRRRDDDDDVEGGGPRTRELTPQLTLRETGNPASSSESREHERRGRDRARDLRCGSAAQNLRRKQKRLLRGVEEEIEKEHLATCYPHATSALT